jgi:ABC-type transporter Mla subunit MlaD
MDFTALAPLLTVLASAVTIIIAVVFLAKLGALTKQLNRLSEQIPGTSMTAKELADELGGSIDKSFQSYMPQPDKVSSAITESVQSTLGTVTKDVEGVHKRLIDSQDALLDKFMAHEKDTVQGLEGAKAALDGIASQLTAAVNDGQEKMNASFDGGAAKLTQALETTAKALKESLSEHAAVMQQSSQALQQQLEKIADLEKDIAKLLHVQEATEGTLKAVTATEEFKSMISSLKTHLEQSDSLLREVAKPKKIRLVEQDVS